MHLPPPPLRLPPFAWPLGAAAPQNAQWIGIFVAGATILYVVFRPGARKKKDPLARPPSASSLAQQRNVERQMQNLLVELSEMARQVTAQLDTRSAKLQVLMDEADDRIAAFHRLARDAPPPPTVAEPAAIAATAFEPSLALVDAADARHQRVYALADQGRSAPDIARELDRPCGEVELILALRPR